MKKNAQSSLIVAAGTFGESAAQAYRRIIPAARISKAGKSGSVPNVPLNTISIVFIAGRPYPSLSKALSKAALVRKISFLSVTLRNDYLLVGPLLLPNIGPCWKCWELRERAADANPSITYQVGQHYEQHPSQEPGGYLASLASVGASLAAGITMGVSSDKEDASYAGAVVKVDLFCRSVTRSYVVECDNCEVCAPDASLATRSWLPLRSYFKQKWPDYTYAWQPKH